MKKAKRMICLILTAAMLFTMGISLTGCKSSSKKLSIALICSAAGPNDNGYNQSAIEGLKEIKKDYGIDYKVVQSNDIPGSLTELAGAGYKLIFSLEYDFDALISGVGGKSSIASQYPDTTFVIFNADPNKNTDGTFNHKNVISVMFDVQQASFMAGALSVYVNENASTLFNPSDYSFTLGDAGRKTGFLGGSNSDGITVFSYGFAEGVNYVAKQMGVHYTCYTNYNAGFTDSAGGATTAGTFYSNGANVVFGCAGNVGDGIDSKAKEVKKLSIEVDANKDNAQPGYILTSVVKNTRVPVIDIAKHYQSSTMSKITGSEMTYDLASTATDITDLSTIGSKVVSSGQAKWSEIKTDLKDIQKKIASGDIKITNAQVGEKLDKSTLTNVTMPND